MNLSTVFSHYFDMKLSIEEAGLTFADIVSGNIYLRNINDYGPMNELYPDYFEANGPGVSTCFQPKYGWEKTISASCPPSVWPESGNKKTA